MKAQLRRKLWFVEFQLCCCVLACSGLENCVKNNYFAPDRLIASDSLFGGTVIQADALGGEFFLKDTIICGYAARQSGW